MTTTASARAHAWLLPAGVVTICIVLSFSGRSVRQALAYTRDDVAAGRVWQLVSGHLEHVDASHALLNLVAFCLVVWTFSRDLDRWTDQSLVLACGVVGIDAALWFLHPEVSRYAGLSGLLHAWFAAGATLWVARVFARPIARMHVAWGTLLLVGLVVKLAIEADGDAFWNTGLGVPVVTPAHRWGAVAGVVAGATLALRRSRVRA